MTIILFLLIFGTIVIVHEFGHFLLAKKNHIRVIEFAVGMGPSLLSFKRGDTTYSLKLLPIGGACIFDGEDGVMAEAKETDELAFPAANVWARISSVLAGPIFNLLLAFVFSMVIVAFVGSDRPVIQEITEGSAAQQAGLQAGDLVKEINGEKIHLYRQISLISAMNRGETLSISYERDGTEGQISLTPAYDAAEGRYFMGILGAGERIECNVPQLFQYSWYEVEYWVNATFKSLGALVKGQVSKDDVAGPLGVAQLVGSTYEESKQYGVGTVILSMMNLAILLSVNIGILNLLPFPALDGGRLVFLLLEAVRGKPVNPEKEGMVHLAGMIVLMVLMVFVLFNDITRFF